MRSLPLHVKTTLLAAALILLVMAATLGLFGSRVLANLRENQKELAELQAASLAEQISSQPSPRDYKDISDSVALVNQARPNIVAVRVWEREGGVFIERVRNSENLPSVDLSEEIKSALRSGQTFREENSNAAGEIQYRVLVPVREQTRVSGAVEVVENLDTSWTLARRFVWTEIWLAAGSVILLSAAIYGLFNIFVYQPLELVVNAIRAAKAGDLNARVDLKSEDEIGELAAELNRMLAQISDMTAEREAQKDVLQERVLDATAELKLRNEQLERASRELWQTARKLTELERLASAGQTAAQFAHEVGTPLNLISGHVQLLQMHLGENEAARKRLETITTQIERIEKIVRTMLDRTRFSETEFENLNLNALLQRIAEVIAPTLEAKRVALTVDLNQNLPEIRGNADHLQQVFINLVNNALDAMPAGGDLLIKTDFDAAHVTTEISDSGTGMNEATQARIFEPLFTTKQRGQGTGLGLVVVREILQEHDAEISVESEIARGTKFYLSFPIAKT